jgi:hypothetical protein
MIQTQKGQNMLWLYVPKKTPNLVPQQCTNICFSKETCETAAQFGL